MQTYPMTILVPVLSPFCQYSLENIHSPDGEDGYLGHILTVITWFLQYIQLFAQLLVGNDSPRLFC